MPSAFEEAFDMAFDALADIEAVTADFYTAVASSTSTSVQVIFNEQAGFVDGFRRAIFTVDRDVIANPLRGDFFILDGETDRWTIVDVRNDQAGAFELRCDGTLERQ